MNESLRSQAIILVNRKFLAELEQEFTRWPVANFGKIMQTAVKSFKGPYTRYVNNYDQAERTAAP